MKRVPFSSSSLLRDRKRGPTRRGIALITVLSLLAVTTILTAAFFSLAKVELNSAATYEGGIRARQLAETAVNIVIGQIRRATMPPEDASESYAWASQPGAIRRYDSAGIFDAGFNLYSSSNMVVDRRDAAGEGKKLEQTFVDAHAPDNWNTAEMLSRFTDLNAPLVKTRRSGIVDTISFPIIDPRAAWDDVDYEPVRGFRYDEIYSDGSQVSGAIPPESASDPEDLRLPMPVEWLYVLEDGTVGYLDANDKFLGVSPGGGAAPASAENPIVGRIAFWTDDESSKININTASEPTFWDTPRAGGELDLRLGKFQPAQREYQRYPGHPATTALSPVLFPDPGRTFTPAEKELIYAVVPRINGGGSVSGTKLVDETGGIIPDQDRLYATLDELIFDVPENANENVRPENPLLSPEIIARSRFFLTANSRAPETNLFNLPRVSMWPTHKEAETEAGVHRTAFDELIRFCSTVAGDDTYFFERFNSDSPTDDYEDIPNNQAVLNYLRQLTSMDVPGFGETFLRKYGDDRDQILTEMFDYIRSTNLYDDNLEPLYYPDKEWKAGKKAQYTDGRFANAKGVENVTNVHPGHGQVAPIRIEALQTTGFGRFFTISEVGILFLCNADGTQAHSHPKNGPRNELRSFANKIGAERNPQTDEENYPDEFRKEMLEDAKLVGSFGGAGARANGPGYKDPADVGEGDTDGTASEPVHLYSNFPKIPGKLNPRSLWPEDDDGYYYEFAPEAWKKAPPSQFAYGTKNPLYPGYLERNWNRTLESDTPMDESEKRVQAVLLFEMFSPSQGWTQIAGDFSMNVTVEKEFSVDGQDLDFPSDTELWQSSGTGFETRWGGNSGFWGLFTGAPSIGTQAPERVPLKADANYAKDQHRNAYPFISVPVTITDDDGFMSFSGGRLKIEIFTGMRDTRQPGGKTLDSDKLKDHLREAGHLVQTLYVEFPASNEFPIPHLVTTSRGKTVPAYWWGFNRQGIGIGDPKNGGAWWTTNSNTGVHKFDIKGRLQEANDLNWAFDRGHRNAKNINDPGDPEQRHGLGDVIRTMVPRHGDYRLIAAQPVVNDTEFIPHRDYHAESPIEKRLAHHFTGKWSNVTRDAADKDVEFMKALVTGAAYHDPRTPDLPFSRDAIQSFGDFDNGTGFALDGPYINKPDEGNGRRREGDGSLVPWIPYFSNDNQELGTEAYYSPSRQVPSPVMFGSLPTGVKNKKPWQTLLFRPQINHSGSRAPRDHLLLDLFWMPVVEPYAISEPFSTAGKINLNYQILPFTHITRSTGVRAVMMSEEIACIPKELANLYKRGMDGKDPTRDQMTKEEKVVRRKINLDETLRQFDERFKQGDVFKSASEICDVHLIPDDPDYLGPLSGNLDRVHKDMFAFWSDRGLSGDNSRERPYANIYPRLTTKSNTFRVHYRAQTIRKSSFTDPEKFVRGRDTIGGEYRGSTAIERYIDPNAPEIPDYREATGPEELRALESLDSFYNFRIVSTRRFDQ